MKFRVIVGISLATAVGVPADSRHFGPEYGIEPPAKCELDRNSKTEDDSDGHVVKWTDAFNCEHVVTLGPAQAYTLAFPIVNGNWVWFDDDTERTGFNESVTWVVAQFAYSDGDIKITATGYRSIPATVTEWQQVGDWLKENGDELLKVVTAGVMKDHGVATTTQAESINGAVKQYIKDKEERDKGK